MMLRARVLKIVKELNYEPNMMARMLGSKKQYYFAALLPDHNFDNFWLAPKHGIEKAEQDLKQYGVTVEQFVFDPQDAEDYVKKAEEITQKHPMAFCFRLFIIKKRSVFFERWKEGKHSFCTL